MADISSVARQTARKAGLAITSPGTSARGPARRSMPTKATSSTTHAANRARMRGSAQPQSVTWSSASSSAISPVDRVATPGTSIPSSAPEPRLSATLRQVTKQASAAIGRLANRIQRQLSASVNRPPSSGPAALPKPAEPMISPPASAARSSGRISYVIPSTAGHIIAPPMPIRARQAISQSSSCAAPPSTEKAAKIAAPMKKMRRRPSMSASRPPVTISTPNTRA